MWPEVKLVKDENKREINISHDQLTKLLTNTNDAIDRQLFEQSQLNYVQLTNSERLTEIPDDLGKLQNLQTLLLFGNKLTSIPGEIWCELDEF